MTGYALRPESRWERGPRVWPLWIAALLLPPALHATVLLTILPVVAVGVIQVAVHRWRRQREQARWDDEQNYQIEMMRYQAELNAEALSASGIGSRREFSPCNPLRSGAVDGLDAGL